MGNNEVISKSCDVSVHFMALKGNSSGLILMGLSALNRGARVGGRGCRVKPY